MQFIFKKMNKKVELKNVVGIGQAENTVRLYNDMHLEVYEVCKLRDDSLYKDIKK